MPAQTNLDAIDRLNPNGKISYLRSHLTSVELCAGCGGQALGLESAGFRHVALVEIDAHGCATLRKNRPLWKVVEKDIRDFDGSAYEGVDLLAAGLPCPPFSIAGKQLGEADERNLFPTALKLVRQMRPRAVMIENVRGFLAPIFDDFRKRLETEFSDVGYAVSWRLLNASDFGIPQHRRRVVIVAIRRDISARLFWPERIFQTVPPVGDVLYDLMAERGWQGADRWRAIARGIGPTIVGGSLKHGGGDLGPTRARQAWAKLGVDGTGIADGPPGEQFVGMPKLTVRMIARLQGFDDRWQLSGGKTAAYRQVGNAFPPPVAAAVGIEIARCLRAAGSSENSEVAV